MIIELTGVSGSGKTSAIDSILSKLKTEYTHLEMDHTVIDQIFDSKKIINRNHKRLFILINYLLGVLRNVKFHLFSFYIILKYDKPIYAFKSYLIKFCKFYTIRRHNKGDVLLDEGNVHIAFSLFVRTNPINDKMISELKIFISLLILPDLILLKKSPSKDVIKNRLISRGHHRLNTKLWVQSEQKFITKIDSDDLDIFVENNFIVNSILVEELQHRIRILYV